MAETYFSDAEFQRASSRALTTAEWEKGRRWRPILDRSRAAYGSAVRLTSFVRAGDPGTHGNGDAVDLQPVIGNEEDIRWLAFWMAATFRPGEPGSPIGKVLYEAPEAHQRRGHVHVSFQPGASGGLWEDSTGTRKYTQLEIPAVAPTRAGYAGIGLGSVVSLGILYWAARLAFTTDGARGRVA